MLRRGLTSARMTALAVMGTICPAAADCASGVAYADACAALSLT